MIWIILVILYLVIGAAFFGLLLFWLGKSAPDWWFGDEDDIKAVLTMCLFWLPALAVALVGFPFIVAYVIARVLTKRED